MSDVTVVGQSIRGSVEGSMIGGEEIWDTKSNGGDTGRRSNRLSEKIMLDIPETKYMKKLEKHVQDWAQVWRGGEGHPKLEKPSPDELGELEMPKDDNGAS
ncbi:hypothetical protein AMTR_s00033p00120170 [Amborella trichopoda]|uniref:Uncharacterized protein n=1 Tax=Amborella trichopoda TaxID=13333 RepID=U5CM67_AMBTC|nr:hypothetical protein AMTR_s00033p00120170 [Amborella trichopoda]